MADRQHRGDDRRHGSDRGREDYRRADRYDRGERHDGGDRRRDSRHHGGRDRRRDLVDDRAARSRGVKRPRSPPADGAAGSPTPGKTRRQRSAEDVSAPTRGRLFGALLGGHLKAARKQLSSSPDRKLQETQAQAQAAASARDAAEREEAAQAARAKRLAAVDAASAKQRAAEAALVVVRWQGHYSTLAKGDFLQTATDPPVFWRPGKHNASTLQAVLRRRKTAKAALDLQKEGWEDFAAGEKRAAQLQLRLAQSRQAKMQDASIEEGEGSDDGEVAEPPAPAAPEPTATPAPVPAVGEESDDGEVGEVVQAPAAPSPKPQEASEQGSASSIPPAPIVVPQASVEAAVDHAAAAAAAEEEAAALLDDDSEDE